MHGVQVVYLVEGIDAGLPVSAPFADDVTDHFHLVELVGLEVTVRKAEPLG